MAMNVAMSDESIVRGKRLKVVSAFWLIWSMFGSENVILFLERVLYFYLSIILF
jgi:hypothetical protein